MPASVPRRQTILGLIAFAVLNSVVYFVLGGGVTDPEHEESLGRISVAFGVTFAVWLTAFGYRTRGAGMRFPPHVAIGVAAVYLLGCIAATALLGNQIEFSWSRVVAVLVVLGPGIYLLVMGWRHLGEGRGAA